MAVNTFGVSPTANFAPRIWSQQVSDATQATCVLPELIDRSFESELKFGRILQINDSSNPAVRFKSEDTTMTLSNITETSQAITMNRQAYVGLLVENIAETQANIDVRAMYTAKTGYALMATIEGDVTSGLASLPANFSQLTGALGADPTDDDLLQSVRYLDDGDVDEDGRFFYCAPSVRIALLKMDKFTRSNFVGEANAKTAIGKARVGIDVYGAQMYVSSFANNAPAAANQSYAWFCHKRGVALLIQQKPTTHAQFTILEDGWTVTCTVIYQFAERLIAPSTLGGGTSNDRFNVALQAA